MYTEIIKARIETPPNLWRKTFRITQHVNLSGKSGSWMVGHSFHRFKNLKNQGLL